MAKVWPARDGRPANEGEPWSILDLEDAIRLLEIGTGTRVSAPDDPPMLGDMVRNLGWIAGYKHIVIEVENKEANQIEAGFYVSPLSVAEASLRLDVRTALGPDWTEEWSHGPDSDGDPAYWLRITLKESAPESSWNRDNRERLMSEIRRLAADQSNSEWVYIDFGRNVSNKGALG